MPLPHKSLIPVFCALLAWMCTGMGSAAAGGRDLPPHFSVEVFPAFHNATRQQEAVVYHFDGEQVSARWQRTDIAKSPTGPWEIKWVTTTQMAGTFRNGELKGEQTSEMALIEPPGGYGKDYPGGPVARMFYRGVIEGRLQPDGRIKARVTTTPTGQKVLTLQPGTNGKAAVYQWIDQPPAAQTPGVMDYWIPLPTDNWFSSRYILASGAETFRLRSALERLDRYMTEAGENLLSGRYEQARRQIDTIRAEIDDLHRSLPSGDAGSRITFRGLPTDDAVIRRLRLQFMMAKWKEAYTIVNAALDQVQRELADLRNILSANVFKSIIKNYISWSNSIPTDIESGIAGYSTATGLLDLPRGFLGWYEESQKDAGILNDQFRKKRALEELERFYEGKREYIIQQRREAADLLKAVDRSPLMALDRTLQTEFAGLGWAPWRESPRRSAALAQLQGHPNG